MLPVRLPLQASLVKNIHVCGMAISTGVYMGRDAARIAVAELKK